MTNVELLRPSPQQPVNVLALPLEATLRPPPVLKYLTEFLQQQRPLPELPMTLEHFVPSAVNYSELLKKIAGTIRTWTDDNISVEYKKQKASEGKTVVRARIPKASSRYAR